MTFIDKVIALIDKKLQKEPPMLYNITVYSYDYGTGQTTARHYFRNPFSKSDIDMRITSEKQVQSFWPSLTRQTTFYV
jgi:hypothetical protein